MRTNLLTLNLLRQAELMCRIVAPHDLVDVPMYIVPVSRLPPKLGGQSHCIGYTSPSLDLHLQEYIYNWQGRGACMVVHDQYLERIAGQAYESDLFGTVLHELAHVLERPEPYRERDVSTAEQRAQIAREALVVAQAITEERYPSLEPWPWEGHGAKFQRAAYHLWHRAKPLGLLYCPSQIFNAESLHLSPAANYAATFEDEAARMSEAHFKEIFSVPYPEPFSRLWTSDVIRWVNSHSQTERVSA